MRKGRRGEGEKYVRFFNAVKRTAPEPETDIVRNWTSQELDQPGEDGLACWQGAVGQAVPGAVGPEGEGGAQWVGDDADEGLSCRAGRVQPDGRGLSSSAADLNPVFQKSLFCPRKL
jgi:hypothetical protein